MFEPTLQQVTVACAVSGAIYCLIRHRANPSGRTLESVVLKLLAASTIPTGILLLACAFDTSLLRHVSDVGIYVAAAGVALLFVGVKEILK
jgi:hypothetical protein